MIRFAQPSDIEQLMPLVREFYIYEKLSLDEPLYRRLAESLIANPEYGRLLVIEDGDLLVGYAVVGFGFSLEFGGRDALLDEFYVSPSRRGQGLGAQMIAFVEELCR